VAKRGFLIFFFLFIGCRRIYHPSALLLLPPPSLYPRPASWEIVVEGGGQFGRGYYLGERFRAGMGEVVASRSGETFSFRGGGGAFGGKYDSLASTGGSFSSYGGRLFFEGEIHHIRRPEGFIVSAGIYLQVSREGGEYLERLCNSAFCPEENPPKGGGRNPSHTQEPCDTLVSGETLSHLHRKSWRRPPPTGSLSPLLPYVPYPHNISDLSFAPSRFLPRPYLSSPPLVLPFCGVPSHLQGRGYPMELLRNYPFLIS